ncbi:MAG: ABC transporter substrate-binding protein [Gammaproteobacteria bacterium]|nr:ABC transporter substrate-binding protein [Gammaproteobacteria bacterium]
MKRIPSLSTFLVLLALALPAWSKAQSVEGPRELVMRTTDLILEKIREERSALDANPRLIDRYVVDIVLPHFDFVSMSRSVLGKHWRRASSEEQEAFVEEFRGLLVRTYATALLDYTDEKIDFAPLAAEEGATDVTVRTTVAQPSGIDIQINYSMERQEDGWKVYDVTIDGLSLVANYRSTFGQQIRRLGIDGLIESIRKGNVDAHAG